MLYNARMDTAIERAIAAVGGPAKLAAACGVTRQAVGLWIAAAKAGKRLPADRILDIERACGGAVSRHELDPKLYPVEEAA